MSEIKNFVRLKYEIPTPDSESIKWDECLNTYPDDVKKKWAWRCGRDIADFADKNLKSQERIRDAKSSYYIEATTMDELDKAWSKAQPLSGFYAAGYIAETKFYDDYQFNWDLYNSIREEKWKLYVKWLVEELDAHRRPITDCSFIQK